MKCKQLILFCRGGMKFGKELSNFAESPPQPPADKSVVTSPPVPAEPEQDGGFRFTVRSLGSVPLSSEALNNNRGPGAIFNCVRSVTGRAREIKAPCAPPTYRWPMVRNFLILMIISFKKFFLQISYVKISSFCVKPEYRYRTASERKTPDSSQYFYI